MSVARLDRVWRVEGTLFGKCDSVSKNMSGIACEQTEGFPRDGLVIDDERQFAQVIRVKDGTIEAKESIRLIEDTFSNHQPSADGESDRQLSLDGEGVAYAKGFFYVIGSHGYPRHPDDPPSRKDAAQLEASSQLVRISIADRSPTISKELKKVMESSEKLRGHVGQPLEDDGVSIEGVAILGNRLFAGLRSPLLEDDRAVILSVSLAALFGDGPHERDLKLLALGSGRGVRDLAAWKDGLLVLAGPSKGKGYPDGEEAYYSVFWWDGSGHDTTLLGDLAALCENGKQTKPEAILPLDANEDDLRILIFFDGAKQGAPRSFFVLNPLKRS